MLPTYICLPPTCMPLCHTLSLCLTSQVELKALWLGQKEGEGTVSAKKSKVDRVMGVKRPMFKKQYHPTRLNSNYLYHSVSMMMVGVASHMI